MKRTEVICRAQELLANASSGVGRNILAWLPFTIKVGGRGAGAGDSGVDVPKRWDRDVYLFFTLSFARVVCNILD